MPWPGQWTYGSAFRAHSCSRPSVPPPSPCSPPDLLPSCLGQFYSNGGHSGSAGGGGGGGGGGSSGYSSYYQGDNYNSPVPPKHASKKQPHGGQQKPSYGSGYPSHQGQQPSYNQSQYSSYGPPQGKPKGYNHGQGNYSYSNSYSSPGGGGGSDYSYESKFSELASGTAAAWLGSPRVAEAQACSSPAEGLAENQVVLVQGRHLEDPRGIRKSLWPRSWPFLLVTFPKSWSRGGLG